MRVGNGGAGLRFMAVRTNILIVVDRSNAAELPPQVRSETMPVAESLTYT